MAAPSAEKRPSPAPDPLSPQRSHGCTNLLSGARYDFKHMEQLIRKDSAPKNFRAAVDDAEPKNMTLYTLKHPAASRMIRAGGRYRHSLRAARSRRHQDDDDILSQLSRHEA